MGNEVLTRLADRLSDRYQFLSKVGKGGWGTVFEVLNLQLDRREALKVVTADTLDSLRSQRFAHEARIVAALDHPRIVKIYAFGEEDGVHWYSMQLLDGPTLGDLIDAGWRFDETMLARMALPLMDALDYSHGRGVIHRDIKPANILFNGEGRPFLADFGIAKSRENLFETQTGQMLGTPAFISPEQALGEVVDARADQYSFAITLYKAITGVLPFSAEGQIQTLMQRVRQDPDPIWTYRPDLAPGFAKVIMRALLRYRDDRWASLAEMRQAMLEACAENSIVWNHPLEGIAEFPLTREPLPADLQSEPRAIGTGRHHPDPDPTADLLVHRSPRPRRWPWVVSAAAVIGLGWFLAGRVLRPAEPAGRAEENRPRVQALPPAAAAAREPVREIPREKPPAAPPAAEPAPRGAVYRAELLDTGMQPTVFPSACQGVKVNVSLLIGVDGQVKACNVKSKVSEECAEAARTLAMRYQFKPAMDAEKRPVESLHLVAIDF